MVVATAYGMRQTVLKRSRRSGRVVIKAFFEGHWEHPRYLFSSARQTSGCLTSCPHFSPEVHGQLCISHKLL